MDTRLEQIRNLRSCKLQLPTPDTYSHILIKRRAKGNELQVLLITEESLGRLIESFRDVIYCVGCAVFGVLQFLFEECACSAGDKYRAGEYTWKQGRRVRLAK